MHCALHQNREEPLPLSDTTVLTSYRSPKSRCTVVSVAAHSLYEKTRPDILHSPGGALLLSDARYEQLPDNRTVRVRGSRLQSAEQGQYTVRLEGARTVGYFSIFIGAIRDPILLSQLDSFISWITAAVKQKTPFDYDLKSMYTARVV